jgi:hypothetical protein
MALDEGDAVVDVARLIPEDEAPAADVVAPAEPSGNGSEVPAVADAAAADDSIDGEL